MLYQSQKLVGSPALIQDKGPAPATLGLQFPATFRRTISQHLDESVQTLPGAFLYQMTIKRMMVAFFAGGGG